MGPILYYADCPFYVHTVYYSLRLSFLYYFSKKWIFPYTLVPCFFAVLKKSQWTKIVYISLLYM